MTSSPAARERTIAAILVAVWLLVYAPLLLLDHLSLRTNAFDLSVFDYALWSTTHGPRIGYVPFYGQTLNSHHFMPTLWLLWPLHALWPSPVLLIGVQLAAMAAAGLYFTRLSVRRLALWPAIALSAVFLFSRRSHGMVTSVFYIECLEPLLLFGMMAAAQAHRWRLYWVCTLLLLGCKEDMPLYTGAFGVLLSFDRGTRRAGLATIALSIVWLALAFGVFIPQARIADGFSGESAFITARYGESPMVESVGRIFRLESLRRLASLTLAVGFICWLRPKWLLVAAPGLLLNLAARDDALQSGLVGHYLWPILPMVFLAALDGAAALQHRPRLAAAWAILVVVGAAADNPALRPSYVATRWHDATAARPLRDVLEALPATARVAAQPQLIPHVAKRLDIQALGNDWRTPLAAPDVVALSTLGDQWPLTPPEFERLVARFDLDPALRRVSSPPGLYLWLPRERPIARLSPAARR